MIELYKRIRQRREALAMSQDDLAKKLGYKSRSSINKIELGENDIPQSKITAFAKALDTTPTWLMGWGDDHTGRIETLPSNIIPIDTKKIPLLGKIAAGQPILAVREFDAYVECGAEVQADFALRVKGDSMIGARIFDGDIVFIREQPIVSNGEIAAVIMNGEEVTLKRFRQVGNMVILSPENPAYEDIVVDLNNNTEVRILGKAIAFQSDVR